MKARIRGTNIEVDVQPLYDETGFFAGFKDGYEYYRIADLVFPDTPDWDNTDWESFRRDASKGAMCVLIGMGRDDGYKYSPHEVARYAIVYADELIKQLKEDEI